MSLNKILIIVIIGLVLVVGTLLVVTLRTRAAKRAAVAITQTQPTTETSAESVSNINTEVPSDDSVKAVPAAPAYIIQLSRINRIELDSTSYTLKKGGKVFWKNVDTIPLTVTIQELNYSTNVAPGASVEHIINTAGRFTFGIKEIPPVKGRIVVTE